MHMGRSPDTRIPRRCVSAARSEGAWQLRAPSLPRPERRAPAVALSLPTALQINRAPVPQPFSQPARPVGSPAAQSQVQVLAVAAVAACKLPARNYSAWELWASLRGLCRRSRWPPPLPAAAADPASAAAPLASLQRFLPPGCHQLPAAMGTKDLDDEFARFQAELFEAEIAAKQEAPAQPEARAAGRAGCASGPAGGCTACGWMPAPSLVAALPGRALHGPH